MDALDMVRPLVGEAVMLLRSHRAEVNAAKQRRVDPKKSPAVIASSAKLDGACALLARMWRLLGMDDMDTYLARRVVEQECQAQDNPSVSDAHGDRIVVA